MKTTRLFLACSFIALLGGSIQGRAEDIDLYSSAASVSGMDLPNVLFILDNAANFNASAPPCTYGDDHTAPSLGDTSGGIEQCALVNAINALPVKADGTAVVNIGIMAYNKSGMSSTFPGCNAGGTGGCLVAPLTPMTSANKTSAIAAIKALTSGIIQANNEATAQAMQEAWAYYAGKTGMSGTTYTSPALSGCQKNYIIFIGNAVNTSGHPGDASATPGTELATTIDNNTALTADQKTMLKATILIAAGAYGTSAFACDPNPYTMGNSHTQISGLYADEWARYMHDVDIKLGSMPSNRKIVTYTIGVLSSACKSEYPALLTSMAIRGGGKYFATGNAADITQAILRVLNEVQAVNSVFSSSSLPVSVNTQGTYLNQIFMGMFRPDAQGTPRWVGNLKQYQFNYDPTTQNLFLADAVGIDAISGAGTGFLSPNAASFWTCGNATRNLSPTLVAPYDSLATCNTDPADGFWENNPSGIGLTYDLPDGEVVEKGGAAQMLRLSNFTDDYTAAPGSTTNPRNLYTYCPSGTACGGSGTLLSAAPFDTSNAAITDALLGTGPVAISSITSAATLAASSTVPGASGVPATVTITNLKVAGSTVTATVSAADLLKLAVGTQLRIATGAPKYDCNPCTVASINTGTNEFTYSKSGGTGTPALPSTATIYVNSVTMTRTSHGQAVGQTVTVSGCTLHTALNGTVNTVTAVTTNDFTLAIGATLATTGTDTACSYTPNKATVTTAADHSFASGSLATVAGATPAGYNGTWHITVTDATHFTYEYTAAAPLANFTGGGATATSSSTTRDALTRWVRGEDNYGDEASLCPPGTAAGTGNCPNPAVNIRPSVHGDVLHSRPVVLNYGGATVTITATADSGSTRTATASAADVAKIGANGAQANVNFANGNSCTVTVASSTTFTYPTSGCGASGAQTAATSSPNVVVFYGGNDGVFRAANGNQVNPPSSSLPSPGRELWGFIPTEFFSKLKRQHDNSPVMQMPSTLPGIIPTPQKKDYFVDGSTGIYQVIDGTGRTTTAYLYLAMRRGARLMYALDVTDPSNPKFLWKHSNADTGFSELGQTWSQPKVAMVNGYATPVLIFGAGYDAAAEDAEPPTADSMGRGIFILDAATGALVWQAGPSAGVTACSGTTTQASCQVAGMNYSIPSDISLLDRNSDGKVDRLYVGDMRGNVWRVDLEPTNKTNALSNTCTATTQTACTPDIWQVEKLAALGCPTGVCAAGTTPPTRKIFYPPEVITTSSYDAVFIATGDREHPLYTTTTLNITATADSGSIRTATASTTDVAKIGAVGATNRVTFANSNTCSVTVASTTTFTYPTGCGAAGEQSAATISLKSACAVTNRAYFLKDLATGMDGSGLTTLTESNLFDATSTPWDLTLSGYYVTFVPCEKSVNAPLVVAGYIYFGTNRAKAPENETCEETLGEATGYRLSPFSGTYVSGEFEGGGLPPSPVSGVVNVIDPTTGKTIQVPFCIGCGGEDDNGGDPCGSDSALAGCKPPINVSTTRSRTYWYIKDK